MRGNNYLQHIKWVVLWIAFLLVVPTKAAPQTDDNFFDYLPKYRKYQPHYQIDKIEYRDKRMIVYFRFVVQENGYTILYSGVHPESWYLRTPPRMQGLEIQFKLLELRNIAINGAVKSESLDHLPEVPYETKNGDVITCEMHFVRAPGYIRMLDLIQGQGGDTDQGRLNCFDILVKTKDSPILGMEGDDQKGVTKFEQSMVVQPKANTATTEEQRNVLQQANANAENYNKSKTQNTNPDPIDYTPKALVSVADLSCNERVTLPQVQFRDNEANFSGWVKAKANIEVIADYMRRFPESSIRLHGHTDIFGDHYRNVELSRDRALAVKRALVVMGIEHDRIEVFYYGGTQPIKGYEKGGDINRRVEVEPLCNAKGKQVDVKG